MSSRPPSSPESYRERFNTTKRLAAVVIYPREHTGIVLKALRGTLFTQRGVRNVVNTLLPRMRLERARPAGGSEHAREETPKDAPEGETERAAKLFLIDPAVLSPAALQPPSLSPSGEVLPQLLPLPLSPEAAAGRLALPPHLLERLNRAAEGCDGGQGGLYVGLTTYEVVLSYQNYTMPEILRAIFDSATPAEAGEVIALSGFEQVGHIAHVNLSKPHAAYKFVIGQVILDCNPTVTVVVNKLDAISSVYREFAMEVIAWRGGSGASPTPSPSDLAALDALLTATVRQHGCVFRVPYHRVYWNSRLSHEHTRLVAGLRAGEVLFDVMAGVGPFAIPAARRGVVVHANDLNPVAADFARRNARLNHLRELSEDGSAGIRIYNMDGRAFLKEVVYREVMGETGGGRVKGRPHVVMNLPALAVEFLDVFSPADGKSPWRRRVGSPDRRLLFHVYCFSAAADVLADAVRQVEHHLGYALPEENREAVHLVRDVAPTKRMICVSFTLPPAFWESQTTDPMGLEDPPTKDASLVEEGGENLTKMRKLEP
ncbi:unnamed protein product [Phytomonas sp. EM1]|nr:unnamed protein product [Phytomonas sp. EM1]|eukprot:CCW64975.1 unnamed protein product [Phytomonas sp. isolate EM1]